MHVHDAAHHPQPLVAMHAAQLSVGWMTEERHGSGQLAASAVHPWQGGRKNRIVKSPEQTCKIKSLNAHPRSRILLIL
eukprot:512368-Pyramimonas_sp.AAC.1